uniref:Ig-like domain-containing protein n=1 Tax=Sphenodon punctatus TaxID=8508 RepID=A0A8D0LBP2_SPHPU
LVAPSLPTDPPEAPELIVNVRTLSVTDSSVSEIATCISRNANPLPTISWYKDGVHLPAPTEQNNDLYVVSRTVKEASGLHSVSSALYLRPVKADKDSRFSCQVQYLMPQGRKERARSELFNLTLHYYTEHVNFSLERPSVIKEGDDVRLRCQGDVNPPPEYVFTKKQVTQSPECAGTRP